MDSGGGPSGEEPGDRGRRRSRVRIGIVALVVWAAVTAGIYWWFDSGRNHFFPRKWGTVVEGRVYRSGLIDRRLIEDVLREHGIGTVVDLSGVAAGDPDIDAERAAARRLGIRMVSLGGLEGDGTGEAEAYVGAVEEMVKGEPGRAVLVHCSAGSERTGVAVAFHRMLVEGWAGDRTWEEYRSFRRRPAKDDHLVQYVNEHMARVARRLLELHILTKLPSPLPVFGPRTGD